MVGALAFRCPQPLALHNCAVLSSRLRQQNRRRARQPLTQGSGRAMLQTRACSALASQAVSRHVGRNRAAPATMPQPLRPLRGSAAARRVAPAGRPRRSPMRTEAFSLLRNREWQQALASRMHWALGRSGGGVWVGRMAPPAGIIQYPAQPHTPRRSERAQAALAARLWAVQARRGAGRLFQHLRWGYAPRHQPRRELLPRAHARRPRSCWDGGWGPRLPNLGHPRHLLHCRAAAWRRTHACPAKNPRPPAVVHSECGAHPCPS